MSTPYFNRHVSPRHRALLVGEHALRDNNPIVSDVDGLSKPLVIFDGACGFCRKWIARWKSMTGERVYYVPYQGLSVPFAGIPRENFKRAVHLVNPDGQILSGAHAVFRFLSDARTKRWPLVMYRHVPLVAPICEWVYRLIANHRVAAGRITRCLWGRSVVPQETVLTRWVFMRLMAIIYFIAFVSLGVQILGLVGSHGILPAEHYLGYLHNRYGQQAYWNVPTLAWFDCSDTVLKGACWAGAAFSVLIFFRIAPAIFLLLNWVLYLSLYRVGQTFLSFQWDLLLLEVGLLAIFFAPWKLFPRLKNEPPPSRVAVWLIRILVFRLMFCSGVVKLLDENPADPTWHNLTALTFHYETQCIPNAIAWYAHKLPLWFQELSVVGVFIIEIGLPFLIFLPRRPRKWSCFGLIFLQLLIILTGNYNFFNLLSIAICLVLLDDGYVRRWLPRRLTHRRSIGSAPRRPPLLQRLSTASAAIAILIVSAIWMEETFVKFPNLSPTKQRVLRYAMRLGSVNNYGLFRSMTTSRPEIIVEGSDDGRAWKPYEFKYKPGDLLRRPPFVAPHQPRLDWQMWFAALGNIRSSRNQWFVAFLRELLNGNKQVLALLETNPFLDKPPRYIRAQLYDYHFTDWKKRERDGTWWTRKLIRPYSPVLSKNSFRQKR